MQTFGQRLQQLREEAGLTQQQLAEASGVNVWTIRGYEQGRREPGWQVAIELAKGVGGTVEAFADGGSGEKAEAGQEATPDRAGSRNKQPPPGPPKPRGRRRKR